MPSHLQLIAAAVVVLIVVLGYYYSKDSYVSPPVSVLNGKWINQPSPGIQGATICIANGRWGFADTTLARSNLGQVVTSGNNITLTTDHGLSAQHLSGTYGADGIMITVPFPMLFTRIAPSC
jgi:hypothetical protein